MKTKGRLGLSLAVGLACFAPRAASAFCGFYVNGADAKLFNDATQVVLMRDGTRTVLSMQNDYKGPPEDFALVVPVPVVLQKENVKILSKDVFARLDKLTSPRLVEYWEQDPCAMGLGGIGTLGHGAGTGTGQGFGNGHGRLGGEHEVTIEAQFEVGEYQILILSAKDSSGLDAWLRENHYKIPEGAAAVLKPYVDAGSKFFVAKVDVSKVKLENGHAELSPLRFHYDADKLELPVKLGLLNSSGTQDLIVYVLGTDRYELANYPNVTIPTNFDVAEGARDVFGQFYATLYDRTLEKHPGAVVTEYAWQATSCDPCPGDMQGMSGQDVASLGADVMPNMSVRSGGGSSATLRQGVVQVNGRLPTEVVQRIVRQNFGRFRLCYANGLRTNPNLQGRVSVKFQINAKGEVTSSSDAGSDLPDASVVDCVVKGFKNLSFPEPESGTVSATFPIVFSPGSGGTGPVTVRTSKGPLVVTRLHARYGKSSLGNDLVFKIAGPIVGGREQRTNGALEHGAMPTTGTSSFQARYAIRHPWTGPIACEKPERGIWGPPWPNAGPAKETTSATKLGLTAHTGVSLTTLTNASAADLDGIVLTDGDAGAAAAPDAGPTAQVDGGTVDPRRVPPSSKCGCRVAGDPSSAETSAFGALLLGMLAAARRSRRCQENT